MSLYGEGRHVWMAGSNGEWVEDSDGDTHFGLKAEDLRDLVEDGLALKGEVDTDKLTGRKSVRTWVKSIEGFFEETWDAFKVAESHLVKMGFSSLQVWAWDTRKTESVSLGDGK